MVIKSGKDVKIFRLVNDLSQVQLAEKLDITVKTLSTLEQKPTITVVYQLALQQLQFVLNKVDGLC